MLSLKTTIPEDLKFDPNRIKTLVDSQIQCLEAPEFLEKTQCPSENLFTSDLSKAALFYAMSVYLYQQGKSTYGKSKPLERALVKLRELVLTHCFNFMCIPDFCDVMLLNIQSVIEHRYFEGKYSIDLILLFMTQTQKLYSLLLAEVKAVYANFTATHDYRERIYGLLRESTKLFDIFYDINYHQFGDEDIEDIEGHCIRLRKRIYAIFSSEPVMTPQFFALITGDQVMNPEKKLFEATDYFFDFDDTLYHLIEGVIKDEVALLVRLAHCLGIRCHIITARNDIIEHADEYILAYQESDQVDLIKKSPGTSIPQLIQLFGLVDIFNKENIIYCNFKCTDINENGIPRITSIKHHKHKKIDDFKGYCEKKQIKPDKVIIFDDNNSVWDSDELSDVTRYCINNLHEHLSFFYKLSFCLAQVLLYNETIAMALRLFVAEEFIVLLSAKSPVLYQPLSQKLSEFISKSEPVLSPC